LVDDGYVLVTYYHYNHFAFLFKSCGVCLIHLSKPYPFFVSTVDLVKPGTTVIFRNAKIDMFKGTMRLAVDKWGRIEVTDPASFQVKEDNNVSLVEYELVDVVDED
jgi:asparagine synthetase B (glutamine-hydrolysing)